jgi:hypothetical protein
LSTACNQAPASPSSLPQPLSPPPASPQFRVSGTVTDAGGGAPIANATVLLHLAQGVLTTRTGEDGAYAISYEAKQPYRNPASIVREGILGLLAVTDGTYWGDIRSGHWTSLQALPFEPSDIVHDVRLRPVRTLVAGQSMELAVEPDSSLTWNEEWDPWTFPSFDTFSEGFRVSVETDGVLTIDAQPDAGGIPATLTCPYVGCPSWRVSGPVSLRVEGRWSPLYFTLEIPGTSAPQRFEIKASLR